MSQRGFSNVNLVKSEKNSLGNGSYGAVYRAKCDQLVCAAKVLHPILFQTRDPGAYRIVERFQREIEFLSGLRHPNIIQYLGSWLDPESGRPVLFMELMDESLTSFLERSADPPPLPLHVQVDISHDVAQALSHLHRHEVLHRDLSSNNVLLIGSRRAKVTDFGMAKLLGSDPRLTPTYCPGTNAYMSPEALADPPTYTSKLDVFSCGVLFVQLITRKWPNPGPRTYTVQVGNDSRFPSGRVLVEVPELERRKEHLDLISPTHPLLEVALDCLKDKEGQRPTAEQLCSRLIALKESAAYRDSLQQTPETTGEAAPARDQELEQQLRESELRVEDLTQEVQQLTLQKEEQSRDIQQKVEENQQLCQRVQTQSEKLEQGQSLSQENTRAMADLQQTLEEKDAALRAKDELLQEKEREIQQLQQSVRGREEDHTGPLKLVWRDGPPAPFATFGHSVAVSGKKVFCVDFVSYSKILMFDVGTGQWTILQECPKKFFSIAVVNEHLTAIGGEVSGAPTNNLLSLTLDKADISKQMWITRYPPMTYSRNVPTATATQMSLIVAGGWFPEREKAAVEVMDIQTLQWFVVASLPRPLWQATAAIRGDTLYVGGGFIEGGTSTSVLTCEVKSLLQSQSQPQSLFTRLGFSKGPQVWREIASLPVVLSSLVTFHGELLAVGGGTTFKGAHATSEVRQYDPVTNSWNVISRMSVRRCYSFTAGFQENTLVVFGGDTPDGSTPSVEIASIK